MLIIHIQNLTRFNFFLSQMRAKRGKLREREMSGRCDEWNFFLIYGLALALLLLLLLPLLLLALACYVMIIINELFTMQKHSKLSTFNPIFSPLRRTILLF